MLRHSSRLVIDENGKLKTEYLADPVDEWLDYKISEDDVIDLIKARVRAWEARVDGEIVIPTSGGYDSRLLSWCIEDKSRIRSFTYGISDNQKKTQEVVYGGQLAEILGTTWEQIPLGDFHSTLIIGRNSLAPLLMHMGCTTSSSIGKYCPELQVTIRY